MNTHAVAETPSIAAPSARIMPVFSIRPSFDQPLAIVYSILAMVVGTVVVTTLGGLLMTLLLLLLGLSRLIPPGYVFGLLLVASIVVIAPVFFDLRRKAYMRTVWHFYETHVDYQTFHFYLGRRRGRLHYRDIRDVSQRASALQEQRGLTTLYLYAPSMSYQPRSSFAGLRIFDVPLREDYTSRIMNIIERRPDIPVATVPVVNAPAMPVQTTVVLEPPVIETPAEDIRPQP